jgi:hypothetical protein
MALSWQERVRQIVLAGGVLTAGGLLTAGCSGSCGNANPDPCVCDRPSSSSAASAACSEETTCKKTGGIWKPGSGEWGTGGKCEHDSGTTTPDGSANEHDGGSKG